MKRIYVVVGLLFLILLVTGLWWKHGLGPKNKSDKSSKIFIIHPGQGVRAIAHNLKTQGFINDQIVFFLLTKQLGLDKKIEAGDYRISPSMDAPTIARTMTHGTLDIWMTIPEGNRAEEIAEILKAQIPTFTDAWTPQLARYEGYLFPDTYLIPRDASIETIISLLRNTFDAKYQTLGTAKQNLSRDQIVTVASLVEREARLDEDRPLVASVILNRMDLGMKLDIDATLQYALGYQEDQKRWWKKELTEADKQIDSPYNTYLVNGLPPTPISNPGIESLKAVLSPASTEFLYYMTDKNGHNHYGKTLAEHEANIKKYGL